MQIVACALTNGISGSLVAIYDTANLAEIFRGRARLYTTGVTVVRRKGNQWCRVKQERSVALIIKLPKRNLRKEISSQMRRFPDG